MPGNHAKHFIDTIPSLPRFHKRDTISYNFQKEKEEKSVGLSGPQQVVVPGFGLRFQSPGPFLHARTFPLRGQLCCCNTKAADI